VRDPNRKAGVRFIFTIARAFADLERLAEREKVEAGKGRSKPPGTSSHKIRRKSPAKQRRAERRAALMELIGPIDLRDRPALSQIEKRFEKAVINTAVNLLARNTLEYAQIAARRDSVDPVQVEDIPEDGEFDRRRPLSSTTPDQPDFDQAEMDRLVRLDARSAPAPPSLATRASLAYGGVLSTVNRYGGIIDGALNALGGGMALGASVGSAASVAAGATGVGLPVAVVGAVGSAALGVGSASMFSLSRGLRFLRESARLETQNEVESEQLRREETLQAGARARRRMDEASRRMAAVDAAFSRIYGTVDPTD
jgi:hypothetical protein